MNATIMKGERSKLLAVAVVLAMVACALVAFMPSADAADEEPISYADITAENLLAKATDAGVITLDANYELTTALSIDETITIDLAGYALVNGTENHTIVVADGGNLTITDSSEAKTGYVDNVTHNRGTLVNQEGGIVVLNGGTFDRSLEAGTYADNQSNGNSWYTISNQGTMTINAGVTVNNDGGYSSAILNGWNGFDANVGKPRTSMVVNGGEFSGGINTIKNSGWADLTINAGTFTNKTQAVILNYDTANIVGGTFTSSYAAILNAIGTDSAPCGILNVSGGTFDCDDDGAAIRAAYNGAPSFGEITVTGGEFADNKVFSIAKTANYRVTSLSGTVDFSGNTVEISGINPNTSDITFGIGSIVISGTIASDATITAEGEVVIDGVTVSGESAGLTIETVADGTSTVTIADLTVAQNGSLDIQTNVTVEKLVNNGTITIADAADVTGLNNIENKGIQVDGNTARVGNGAHLTTVLTTAGYYGVTEVILTDDIVIDTNLYANSRTVTLYTDGNDLTINGTANLTNLHIQVDEESTLTLGSSSITKFVSNESLQVLPRAIFSKVDGALLGTGDITKSTSGDSESQTTTIKGADIQYPFLNDGSYVLFKGNQYKVNHFRSGEIYIQYGVSGGNVEFTGNAIIADQVPLLVQPFDNNVFNATGNPTYSLTALPEGESYTDARTYTDAIAFRITFLDPNEVTGNGSVTVNGVADLIIQPVDPIQYDVQIEGWEYGSTPNEPTYSYTDLEGNQLPSENVTYSYEMKVDGVWTPVSVEPSEFGVGDYRVIATFAAFSSNYNEVTDSCEFKVTPTTLDVDFGTVDNTDDDMFWGTDPDRYMNFPYNVTVSTTETGKVITVSGGVFYIDNVNEGATQTIYGTGMDRGYYALLNIMNPNVDFALKMTIGDREYTIPANNGVDDNTKQMIFYLGTNLANDATRSIEITPIDNVDYGTERYTLNFDVYRMTTSGYNPISAVDDIAAEGFTRADAFGNVMWIAYDGEKVAGEQPYGYLYYDGKLIYVAEDMTKTDSEYTQAGDSGRIWYFSFVNQVTEYVNANGIEGYEPGQPGKYTMYISTVAPEEFDPTSDSVTSAVEYIEGYVDSGFSHYADAALKDLQDIYKAYGGEYPRSDIADNTLWFSWYQEGYAGQDVKAYISTVENNWAEENLWLNGAVMLADDGLRAFAWSFDNSVQGAAFVDGLELPKTVYVKIEATDSEGAITTVATGTIDLTSEASSVVIDDGMGLTDILGKKPLDFMDITVYQGGTAVTIRGDVYLIDSWETYYAGVDTEGYYIALTVDPSVESEFFDWSQAIVTIINPNNPLLDETHTKVLDGTFDGQLLLFLGNDIESLESITLKVDLDGSEPFLTETTYALDLAGLEQGVRTYTVTYIDDAYGSNGYRVTEYIAGNILTLPVVPDTTKEALGWNVDNTGVLYKCGTRVDLSQLDTNGDYAITFYAEYGSSSGGDTTGDEPRQLWDYQYRYVYDAEAGIMTIYVVTDKLDGYKNVLTTISIAYTDWENGAGGSVTYYISEPSKLFAEGLGIVAEYTFENVAAEGVIHIDAFVGNTWLEQYDFDTTPVAPEPILAEEMTFDIVEAPADAPADNNYPWLQINYERLQTVDSVAFYVDDVQVTNLVWVDSTGEPIEGAPVLTAGTAYLQLSIADGEVTVGEHTFRIVATLGEQTQTIEADYTVTLP